MRKIGNIERFWKQLKNDDPRLAHHMLLAIVDWERKAWPLVLRLDAATFTKNQNAILSVQWSFLLDEGFQWESVIPFAMHCKACRSKKLIHGRMNDTWDEIWSCGKLLFNALFEGKHSSLDPDGFEW